MKIYVGNGVVAQEQALVGTDGAQFHLAVNCEKFKFKYKKLIDEKGSQAFADVIAKIEFGLCFNHQFINVGVWAWNNDNRTLFGMVETKNPETSFGTPNGKAQPIDLAPNNAALAALNADLNASLRKHLLALTETVRSQSKAEFYGSDEQDKRIKDAFLQQMQESVAQAMQAAITENQSALAQVAAQLPQGLTLNQLRMNTALREFEEETQHRFVAGDLSDAMDAEERIAMGEKFGGDFRERNPNMNSATIFMDKAKIVPTPAYQAENKAVDETLKVFGSVARVELVKNAKNGDYTDIKLRCDDATSITLPGRASNMFLLVQLEKLGIQILDNRQAVSLGGAAGVVSMSAGATASAINNRDDAQVGAKHQVQSPGM